MKKVIFLTCIWVMALACAINSNAQIGVTKYGTNALANNAVTGDYNTGLGYFALGANTSGNRNTGSGANVLRFNTTGIYNTGMGAAALYQNTTGYNNSGFGAYALFTNTTGYRNTATGNEALRLNTSGHENNANGAFSLYNNTTGFFNEAYGNHSMYSNTTGYSNTTSGHYVLYSNSTGYYNSCIGHLSMNRNTTGYNNTAIGNRALYENISGSRNTALGSTADVLASNLNNATAIGYGALVNASHKVRVGNTAVTSIGGQVGWTTFSDGRYKKDIQENVQGLTFINSLRPVTYSVNVKGLNEYYNKLRRSSGGNTLPDEDNGEMKKSEDAAAAIIYNGFVAQEVELAAKKLNFEFSGVDKPANDNGLYGLRYDNFISPLVKSVQELSAKNTEKDSLISDLQTQVSELKSLITRSLNGIPITSSGYLKQNAPNPFNQNTVISYHIPDNAGHAQIRITDVNGRLIKAFNAAKGDGQINIRSGELPAGTYSYTLFVNNRPVDTRQMVMQK